MVRMLKILINPEILLTNIFADHDKTLNKVPTWVANCSRGLPLGGGGQWVEILLAASCQLAYRDKCWSAQLQMKYTVCLQAKRLIRPELILVSVTPSKQEYLYSPLNVMGVTPSVKFAENHLYKWVEIGAVSQTFLSQEQ